MGKSDGVMLPIYWEFLEKHLKGDVKNAAFLGQEKENYVSTRTPGHHKFYDRSLGNWEINSDWFLEDEYDLIVCTRCAYFSNNPDTFIKKCKFHLKANGIMLIDWGLGDHWRFQNYKVGWIKNGEHEYAYSDENKLHSCYWNEDLENDENVINFWNHARKMDDEYFGKKLGDVVASEVPHITSYDTQATKTVFLWPESPQLYIITLVRP